MKLLHFLIILSCICVSCDRSRGITDRGEWISLDSTYNYNKGYLYFDNEIYGIYLYESDFLNYPVDFLKDYGEKLRVDVNTFKVCQNSLYAKDKNRVYYPTDIIWIDSDINGWSGAIHEECIIRKADPETFKYLGDGFAVDRKNMYYKGERIEWDDSIIAMYQ